MKEGNEALLKRDEALEDLKKFCRKYPLNYYECSWCGQHEKHHGDPRETLENDRCFRCGFPWKIREGTEMRLPKSDVS